jgi:hypothetical protein
LPEKSAADVVLHALDVALDRFIVESEQPLGVEALQVAR